MITESVLLYLILMDEYQSLCRSDIDFQCLVSTLDMVVFKFSSSMCVLVYKHLVKSIPIVLLSDGWKGRTIKDYCFIFAKENQCLLDVCNKKPNNLI